MTTGLKQDLDKWATCNFFDFLLNDKKLSESTEKELTELIDKYSVKEVQDFILNYKL